MPYTPKPRIMRLVCKLIGPEPRPLVYTEWVDDLPNGEGRWVEVEHPTWTRCLICGTVDHKDYPDRIKAINAGIKTLSGHDPADFASQEGVSDTGELAGEWGDHKYESVWKRHDFNDPPDSQRRNYDNGLPGGSRIVQPKLSRATVYGVVGGMAGLVVLYHLIT